MIADEPTTALDVTIQAQIIELVKQLQEQLGMAIIWITHDLGVTAGIAQRVNVMYAGQADRNGPVKEIYGNPHHPYTVGLLGSLPQSGYTAGRSTLFPSKASRQTWSGRSWAVLLRRAAPMLWSVVCTKCRHLEPIEPGHYGRMLGKREGEEGEMTSMTADAENRHSKMMKLFCKLKI